MSEQIKKTALITGVSRGMGLGFETARQLAQRGFKVFISARRAEAADALAQKLRAEGLDVAAAELDVTDAVSIAALRDRLAQEAGALSALINNASAPFDAETPTLATPKDAMLSNYLVHVVGPWMLVEALHPLLAASGAGRIVNISSAGASFGGDKGMQGGGKVLGAYAVTKAALNALTIKLAAALEGEKVKVNAVYPGWVATYPGTAKMGARPVAEGAKGIVWAATLPDDGPTGGFFRDGEPIPW